MCIAIIGDLADEMRRRKSAVSGGHDGDDDDDEDDDEDDDDADGDSKRARWKKSGRRSKKSKDKTIEEAEIHRLKTLVRCQGFGLRR